MPIEDATPPPWTKATATADVDALLGLFTPTPVATDRFTIDVSGRIEGHLFGGVVAAQALHAGYATVGADRQAQSVHSYFLRAGRTDLPIDFEVHRDTDGRSFSGRRIAATQAGRPIYTMICSFHVPEQTPELMAPLPDPLTDPPAPGEEVETDIGGLFELRRDTVEGDDHVDHRVGRSIWVRAGLPLPDDQVMQDCLLLYVSDYGTPWHVAAPEGTWVGPSLDHSVWLHRRTRLDQWHHIHHDPATLSDARGLYIGRIWRQDGVQVATVAQENLVRLIDPS